MEKLVRRLSETMFYTNYIGIVLGGAFTFVNDTDKKQRVFKQTAAIHFTFLASNYVLTYLKFVAFPYHLSCQLMQDLGCVLACFPTYSVWAYHDFSNYFRKHTTSIKDLDEQQLTSQEIVDQVVKQR
jgi:hypothetical protein